MSGAYRQVVAADAAAKAAALDSTLLGLGLGYLLFFVGVGPHFPHSLRYRKDTHTSLTLSARILLTRSILMGAWAWACRVCNDWRGVVVYVGL